MQPEAASTGAGHDFVLFDDSYGPGGMPSSSSSGSTSTLAEAMGSSSAFPSMSRSKPSFTEYRGPASVGGGSGGGDSPFGSPASRLEDDFPVTGAGGGSRPSSVGSHGSGTLSAATGIPNRKRQRGNDGRGHSSTTSLTGLAAAMGATSSNPSHQRQGSASRGYRQRHSISDDRPIPGLADTTLSNSGDDWSLADTSPQNPPSGSFGPPIGALSLGGGDGSAEQFASLFPELSQQQQQQQQQIQQNVAAMKFQPQAHMASFPNYAVQGAMPGSNAMFPASQPTPAQEAFARQQVRQELASVDQRALRGPLRDLAQGNNNVSSGGFMPTAPAQPNFEADLIAAAQSFAANSQANRGRMGDSRAPGIGLGPKQADPLALNQQQGNVDQQRNLLFPGPGINGGGTWQPDYAAPVAWSQADPDQQMQPSPPNQGDPPHRPPVGPRKRSNSFDASFLPASRPWFSQSPPQQPDMAAQNALGVAPANSLQTGPGGVGMGTGTGWTGEPTNNFNAFDLSGGQALGQTKPQRKPLTRDRSGLTVSPREMYLDASASDEGKNGLAGWSGPQLANMDANQILSQLLMSAGKDGSQVSTPKGQPNMPTYLSKPPMLRADTIRPSDSQPAAPIMGGDRHAPPTAGSSASSGLSLFSPASSDTTPDTDDSDEKPFNGSNDNFSRADYEALLRAQPQFAQPLPPPPPIQQSQRSTAPTRRPANMPRFLPSSSSSSEDEDEDSGHLVPGRVMGPHGPQSVNGGRGGAFGGSSSASSSGGGQSSYLDKPLPSQPLGRGRGLQGGYGYMPGSAESGLAIDPAEAMKSNAIDATMTPANNAAGGEAPSMRGSGAGLNGGSSEASNFGGEADDGSISPSIRSGAQAITPQQGQQGFARQQFQQMRGPPGMIGSGQGRGAFDTQGSQIAAPPTVTQASSLSAPSSRRSSNASSSSNGSQWEGPDAAEEDDDEEEDYEPGEGGGARKPRGARGAPTAQKKAAARRSGGAGTGGAAAGQRKSVSDSAPFSGGDASSDPALAGFHPGGVSTHGSVTVCEYVSPLTGSRCGTEFHRPYDLARHRETIHAKEEASLVRQGKLSKEQCRVLYVEVDPARSQATQEWKCDGRNGCGSVFSRKDALQRHRRLRNH